MFYGPKVWDPVLIISQIVAVQCLWYLSLGCLLWLLLGPYVPRLSLHHVLDWRLISFRSFTGWMVVVANLVNALAASVYLMVIVERAKKCLDFASTLYFLHLMACLAYSGFSHNFAWWAVNLTGFVITAILGEWLSLQREMRDIQVGSGSRRRKSAETVSLNAGRATRTSSISAVVPKMLIPCSSFLVPFSGSAKSDGRGSSQGGSNSKQMAAEVV